MRIFEVITVSEYGGAQSVVLNLLNNLAPDNEVFVIYGGNGEAWESADERVTKLKISSHRKKLSLFKDLFIFFRLIYYRFKYKPDIIHLHSSKMGALGRIAFSPKKIVYTLHGIDSLRMAFRKFLFVEKLLKNRSAKTIAVSKYDVIGLGEVGITKNVELVYNGLTDYTKADKEGNKTELSDQLDKIKSKYSNLVMCVARISQQKKFDLFLDIAKQMPEIAFVWIGNKEEIDNLPSNVFCLGETHAAHRNLKYADLFILPTNYEGLPISILEALSYSVPVIASAVGGVTEMLDGKNGFAVDNNIEAFIDKIGFSLHEDNHSTMSIAARNSYLERFTVDKMANSYRTIFNEVYGK